MIRSPYLVRRVVELWEMGHSVASIAEALRTTTKTVAAILSEEGLLR